MRYGQIRKYDIANGVGIRSTLFVTGCTHGCYNCFNEEYQSSEAGMPWGKAEEERLLSYVKDPRVDGLTLLGGEPFQNIDGLLPLVKKIHDEVPDKSIWVYSGYTYEELQQIKDAPKLLSYCHVLVDGPYVDALRDPALAFRGSANQRVIDLVHTREEGKVVLYGV